MSEKEIDHEYTDEIVCPYCGYEYTDSWEFFHDDDAQDGGDIECAECNKTFSCAPIFSVRYITQIIKTPKEGE